MDKTQKNVLNDEAHKSYGWLFLLTFTMILVDFLREANFEGRFGKDSKGYFFLEERPPT